MKILYLSCHAILEYDELILLHELGHSIFSPGAYFDPAQPHSPMRPGIPGLTYDPDIVEQYNRLGAMHPGEDAKNYLTKEFVDNFDVVIVMHMPAWIHRNWSAMRHKRVIWRTIGQSVALTELSMQPYKNDGMWVLRYSPREVNIPNFCGQDGFIRFYKDPNVYKDWTGEEKTVVTFAQNMEQRGTACSYTFFEQATRPFQRRLFGPENNQPGFGMGRVPHEQLVEELRKNRVYFYTGTHPASYTLNFIEALMTGTPMVAVGSQLGNADVWRDHDLYEIPDIITHGVNGFITDDVRKAQACIRILLQDDNLAAEISRNGRETALKHFNKDMIRAAWGVFLAK